MPEEGSHPQIAITREEADLLAPAVGGILDALDCDDVAAGVYCSETLLRVRPKEAYAALADHPYAHMSRVSIEAMNEEDAVDRQGWFQAHRAKEGVYMRDGLGEISEVSVLRTVVQFLPLIFHQEYQLLDVTIKNAKEQDMAFAHPDKVAGWSPDLVSVDIGIEIKTSTGHIVWITSGPGVTVKEKREGGQAVLIVSNFPTGAHFVHIAIDDERPVELRKFLKPITISSTGAP
jgi:hypothetical protein